MGELSLVEAAMHNIEGGMNDIVKNAEALVKDCRILESERLLGVPKSPREQ